ncbi:MAG: alpha/beta-hydrolase family protein [Austwickia sp.]|nr:MAG: alpha/beta-hydrolase family protein [Austwickia sp.]
MSPAARGATEAGRHRILGNGWGFVGALIMFWQAMTPTLVPRNWWMNAVVIGVSSAFGYLVGSLLRAVWRWLRPRLGITVAMAEPQRTWARRLAIGLLVVVTLVAAVLGHLAQDQVADRLGAPQRGPVTFVVGLVAGAALFAVLVLAGKGIATLRRWLKGHAARFAPDLVASGLATLVIVFVILMLTDSVLFRGLMEPAMEKATRNAARSPEGRSAPTLAERSGSPASRESWDSLGYEGKIFVTSGPTPERIAAVTAQPAKQPIRVYAGKSAHQDVADAARAVVAELERTGAFERSHLLVTTTTGTGWVPEWSMSSFEMLGGGDTAIASMQYSFFPSPLAYVSSRAHRALRHAAGGPVPHVLRGPLRPLGRAPDRLPAAPVGCDRVVVAAAAAGRAGLDAREGRPRRGGQGGLVPVGELLAARRGHARRDRRAARDRPPLPGELRSLLGRRAACRGCRGRRAGARGAAAEHSPDVRSGAP